MSSDTETNMHKNLFDSHDAKIIQSLVPPSKTLQYKDGTIFLNKMTGDVLFYIDSMWITLRKGTTTGSLYTEMIIAPEAWEDPSYLSPSTWTIFARAYIANDLDYDLYIDSGTMRLSGEDRPCRVFRATVPIGDTFEGKTYEGKSFTIRSKTKLIIWIRLKGAWAKKDVPTIYPGDSVTFNIDGYFGLTKVFKEKWHV